MVRNVEANLRLTRDQPGLFNGLEELLPFVAHVRGVQPGVRLAFARERHEFVGIAVAARFVDESSREANGALLHRQRDMRAHLSDLFRRGVALFQSHHVGPDAVVSHQHRVVDGRALCHARRKIAGQVRPIGTRPSDVARHVASPRFVGDGAESAVAANVRSHALGELELHARVTDEGAVVVRVCVNKARRQHQGDAIHFAHRRSAGADGGDAPVRNGHVADISRRARAIDDRDVAESDVCGHSGQSSWVMPRRLHHWRRLHR